MKYIFPIFTLFIFLSAQELVKYPPFIAEVKGVAKNNVLNVRKSPNYLSKKIGYIDRWGMVRVLKCKRVSSKSIWCKVKLLQNDTNSKLEESGWVNAKYLYGYNKGYVAIDGKRDCYYSLGCFRDKCKVVVDTIGDLRNLEGLKIKEITRDRLSFLDSNEASSNKDLCTIDEAIGGYLAMHKLLYAYPKDIAREFYENLRLGEFNKLYQYIHPKKGITISYYNRFDIKNVHFSKEKFKKYLYNNLMVYWGKESNKRVNLGLKDYFKKFKYPPHSHFYIYQISTNSLHFPSKNIIAYKIEPRKTGGKKHRLVLVMQKYRGIYYVVGLMYKR